MGRLEDYCWVVADDADDAAFDAAVAVGFAVAMKELRSAALVFLSFRPISETRQMCDDERTDVR